MILATFITLALVLSYCLIKNVKVSTTIWTSLFVFYLVIVLTDVVGYPRLTEFKHYGLTIFNPDIQLKPFAQGMGFSDRLNIILFVPFGFFIATLTRRANNVLNVIIGGFLFSLSIEIAQLFTNYRISDATDLMTNTIGSVIGFIIYSLLGLKQKHHIFSLRGLTVLLFLISLICFLVR